MMDRSRMKKMNIVLLWARARRTTSKAVAWFWKNGRRTWWCPCRPPCPGPTARHRDPRPRTHRRISVAGSSHAAGGRARHRAGRDKRVGNRLWPWPWLAGVPVPAPPRTPSIVPTVPAGCNSSHHRADTEMDRARCPCRRLPRLPRLLRFVASSSSSSFRPPPSTVPAPCQCRNRPVLVLVPAESAAHRRARCNTTLWTQVSGNGGMQPGPTKPPPLRAPYINPPNLPFDYTACHRVYATPPNCSKLN